jgi:hypothetical protein
VITQGRIEVALRHSQLAEIVESRELAPVVFGRLRQGEPLPEYPVRFLQSSPQPERRPARRLHPGERPSIA